MSKCKIMSPQCHIHSSLVTWLFFSSFSFTFVLTQKYARRTSLLLRGSARSTPCWRRRWDIVWPDSWIISLIYFTTDLHTHFQNSSCLFTNVAWVNTPKKLNRSPENSIFLALSLQPSEKHTFASCSNWFFVVLFRKGDNSRTDTRQRVPNLRYKCPLWCHKGRIPVLFSPAISDSGTSEKTSKRWSFSHFCWVYWQAGQTFARNVHIQVIFSHHKMGPTSLFKAVS